VSALDFQLET